MKKFSFELKVLILAGLSVMSWSSMATAGSSDADADENAGNKAQMHQKETKESELGQVPAGQSDCPIPSDRKGMKEVVDHKGASKNSGGTAPIPSKAEKAN